MKVVIPNLTIKLASVALIFTYSSIHAQEDIADSTSAVEEITVTGSQIKGAKITGSLPVSVLDFTDIDTLGVDGGDELLDNVAENGMNLFNETENASGGVNSARGDMGAYNLRNMGTGNTLTLLNGRRLVNSPGYQTELIGGDYVPAMTVNSTLIPIYGLERMEILRDGASAIYGADAVAGVVNNVMQSDYEGFLFRVKSNSYDHFDANDTTVSIKFGKNLNGGRTNISVFADYYDRERIMATEDPRWGDSDHRKWIPEDSPWHPDNIRAVWGNCNSTNQCTDFDNRSSNSLYGQFDMSDSHEHGGSSHPYYRDFNDSNGEFEVFPLGDPRCSNRSSQNGVVFDTGYGTCIAADGNGVEKFNLWGDTDYRSELQRYNVFVFINHEMDNGLESFTEIGLYGSDSNLTRHPSYAFSSSKHRVGPENYWLNQMALPDGTVLFGADQLCFEHVHSSSVGLATFDVTDPSCALGIDNYRYAELYRKIDVKKTTYRILQGLRGSNEDWDWEIAFLNSRATADDVTHNRLSNNLIKEALWDDTPAAYNPFKAGDPDGLARAVVDVYRKGSSELTMIDFKTSNNEIAQLPAGPLGLLFGFEYRYEKVVDDRDPRLDGTITYTDYEGDTYPLVADVLNSSPTGDVFGSHRVKSFFTELQIPLAPTANAQLAMRYEDSTDVDSALVGKFAVGWDVTDIFKLRASISTAYRAPNIIQVNEKIVVRTGTRNDYSFYRLQQLNGLDTSKNEADSRYSIQRQATGAENLKSEESDNTSVGFVLTPVDGLTITADYWSIEKENTIGLLGRSNHTALDMALRWENGTNNCGSFLGNPAVVREAPDQDYIDDGYFATAGVCPFGIVKYVRENYQNLATRTIEGYDIGIYYDVDTDFGDFAVRYIGSFIEKFEQVPGADFADLAARQAAGEIPADIILDGFGDLLGKDGNYDEKHRLRVTWNKGPWGASVTGLRKGDFYQSSLTLLDGQRYVIPSMTVFDVTVDYKFSIRGSGNNARIRFAVKNAADERAPLADRYYGYFADAHTDLGRNFYVDFRVSL